MPEDQIPSPATSVYQAFTVDLPRSRVMGEGGGGEMQEASYLAKNQESHVVCLGKGGFKFLSWGGGVQKDCHLGASSEEMLLHSRAGFHTSGQPATQISRSVAWGCPRLEETGPLPLR